MSEYREALQNLCDAIGKCPTCSMNVGHGHQEEYSAAKALLARGEPIRHKMTCRLFPDPYDERDPVGPCTCGAISVEPSAAEKAREPMHEGFPVDTKVRDILTDKVGTIVSYHCRFEVEWDDGTSTMDVHCRQLDHCGSLPSPPAATGDQP